MDDFRAALRTALPPADSLDLAAVRARSRALRRRRQAAVLATTLVVLTGAAVGSGALLRSRSTDTLVPAQTPPAPVATTTIRLVFGGCGDAGVVERTVPAADATPEDILRELFRGPGPGGPPSELGTRADGALRSVHLANDSAYVDLDASFREALDAGPGGFGSCEQFDPVGETVRSNVPGVGAVYYALDGDPRAFVEAAGGRCPDPVVPGGPCDPAPFGGAQVGDPARGVVAPGLKAPQPSRLTRTDEFGIVASIERTGTAVFVEVNRVDMLGGAEGEAAARARGQEVSNDYFLVDENPLLRRYRVDPSALVWGSIGLARTVEPTRVPVEQWLDYLDTPAARTTLFHLQIKDGAVVGVEEQYRP